MKGDFSKWSLQPNKNFNDVLHQQGKVLLDRDWNDQVILSSLWKHQAGQDVFGAHVMAVPTHAGDSFKVDAAQVVEDHAKLKIHPGHGWLNGRLVHLEGQDLQEVQAVYLEASVGNGSDVGEGVCDAVVLEVWQEAVNGYQLPEQLIEPALGGPDTTERLHTAKAFKLFRLHEGDHCRNIRHKFKDDRSELGQLEVTLSPTITSGGPCPVVTSGGYSGFEHNLYRIEIAHLNAPEEGQRFKWSSLNGGLVGRGDYDASDPLNKSIAITANLTAITTHYRKDFYLEIVEYSEELGHWQIILGAEAVLNGNVLELGQERYSKKAPTGTNVFFRLWDGTALIEAFKEPSGSALPQELKDGIRLSFEDESLATYRPGDFWQFTVRAGETTSDEALLDRQGPQGPIYHRAALAIINWDRAGTASAEKEEIDDCRRRFNPLTNQKICCSFTIGDGENSQGDFNDFDEALRQLPEEGGQLCLLPGVHRIHSIISQRKKIKITGCGLQTMVTCLPDNKGLPNFHIIDSQEIELSQLTIMSMSASGIRLENTKDGEMDLDKIVIRENRIVGLTRAIEVFYGNRIVIKDNHLAVFDKPGGDVAVFLLATKSDLIDNTITVVPDTRKLEPENGGGDDHDPGTEYLDDCADEDELYTNNPAIVMLVNWVFTVNLITTILLPYQYQAKGGVQIASTSRSLLIKGNRILGGSGHGLSIGHLPQGQNFDHNMSYYHDASAENLKMLRSKMNSYVYDLTIRDNQIEVMGLSGISSTAFFNSDKLDLLFAVKQTTISGNTIRYCCRQITKALATDHTGTVNVSKDMALGGIILADAEEVVMRENKIEKNGLSHLQAICGIWIGHGEKIDILDNRIIDNAPRSSLEDEGAAKGWRGGIVIRLALAKMMEDVLSLFGDQPVMFQDSLPAAKIHDNTVVQPLGQALMVLAMGPVSVVNNHFTSQGTVNVYSEEIEINYDYMSLIGATVVIADLGIAKDIFPLFLMKSFRQIGKMDLGDSRYRKKKEMNQPMMEIDDNISMTEGLTIGNFDLSGLLYLPSGQVMFNDNRTTLDLRGPAMSMLLSSQTIISLDDISFANNQSEIASVLKFDQEQVATTGWVGAITEADIAGNNTMLMAFTVRATNNRFQDGLTQGIPQKGYSLFSYGLMNTTMGNQATNCLLPLGPAKYNFKAGNSVIIDTRCRKLQLELLHNYQLAETINLKR